MNNNDNYYELFMDLFEAVINNSTWGNSKNGGPVWIWDFRIENLKKLIPAHPLLQELDEEKNGLYDSDLYEIADNLITELQLCNILIISDWSLHREVDVYFYSLVSFCRQLSEVLQSDEPEIPLRKVSFILRDQSPKILYDDYIWGMNLCPLHDYVISKIDFPNSSLSKYGDHIGYNTKIIDNIYYYLLPYPNPEFLEYEDEKLSFCQVKRRKFVRKDDCVKPISDWKIWLPIVIYDCLELQSIKYWGSDAKVQYPLMHYNEKLSPGCVNEVEVAFKGIAPRRLKLKIPAVKDPKLWHKDFIPKQYWETCEG